VRGCGPRDDEISSLGKGPEERQRKEAAQEQAAAKEQAAAEEQEAAAKAVVDAMVPEAGEAKEEQFERAPCESPREGAIANRVKELPPRRKMWGCELCGSLYPSWEECTVHERGCEEAKAEGGEAAEVPAKAEEASKPLPIKTRKLWQCDFCNALHQTLAEVSSEMQ